MEHKNEKTQNINPSEKMHNLMTDICAFLNGCSGNKNCSAAKQLLGRCQNLIITSADQFYIDAQGENTNKKLIAMAKKHGFDAGVIVDSGHAYVEFITKA